MTTPVARTGAGDDAAAPPYLRRSNGRNRRRRRVRLPRAAGAWFDLGAWVVFAIGMIRAVWLSITNDFRAQRLVADQASFLDQAMSLIYDHDLRITSADVHHWTLLHWPRAGHPTGLYLQRFGDGWAYAKPFGYSYWLAPFVYWFGPVRGVAVANTVLFVIAVAAVILLLRRRYRGAVVPLVVGALMLVTNVMLYLFPIGVELFYVCLLALFFLAAWYGAEGGLWPALAAVALAGFLFSEKASFALVVGPVLVWVLVRQRGWARRAGVVGVGVAVVVVSVVPYWHYSQGKSITPYGGRRYYAYNGLMPFQQGAIVKHVKSDETISVNYVVKSTTSRPNDKAWAAAYYVAGEHIGLLVFMPIAVFVVALALWDIRRSTWYSRAALIGLGLYVLFYIVLFPRNVYGGGQAIGNRYFVQIAPVVIAIAVASGIKARRLAIAGVVGVVLPIIMLWPQLYSPRDDLYKIYRNTPLQRLMLYEQHIARGGTYFFHPPPPIQRPPALDPPATGAPAGAILPP